MIIISHLNPTVLERLQSSLILIFLVCTLFTENLVLYILMGVLSIGIGIYLFRKNKKDLKSALFYIRTKRVFWKSIVSFIVFCIIFIYLNWFVEFEEVFIYIDKVYLLIFPVIIRTLFTSHYSNFVTSIRAYENGLKLPKKDIVQWQNISSLTKTNKTIEIIILDEKSSFFIQNEDEYEFDNLVATWQKTCALR